MKIAAAAILRARSEARATAEERRQSDPVLQQRAAAAAMRRPVEGRSRKRHEGVHDDSAPADVAHECRNHHQNDYPAYASMDNFPPAASGHAKHELCVDTARGSPGRSTYPPEVSGDLRAIPADQLVDLVDLVLWDMSGPKDAPSMRAELLARPDSGSQLVQEALAVIDDYENAEP